MFSFSWRCSKSRSTRSRAGDASLWAITSCSPSSVIVTCLRPASGCCGAISITSSSEPRVIVPRPRSAGGNDRMPKSRLRCSTSTPIWREGTRRMSSWMRGHCRRKCSSSGSSTCTAASFAPTQHAPALQIAQVADRRIGLLGEAHQPLRVVEEHAPGFGELAVLGGSIEEPLAEVVLETLDGLADRRLGAMQPGGCLRETSLRGDGQKNLQLSQIHGAEAFYPIMQG